MVELDRNQNHHLVQGSTHAIWEVRSTSNGREATVTERAARSNPDPFSTQKVIDALLKALSTPGGQNLVFTYRGADLMVAGLAYRVADGHRSYLARC